MFASWLYFIGNKENKSQIFLYGLSLPTDNNVAMNSKPQKIGRLSSGEEIYLFFSIINIHPEKFCQNNKIKFNSINNNLAIEVIYNEYSEIIQSKKHYDFDIPSSPVASTITMHSYYTDDFFSFRDEYFLREENKEILREILDILEKDTAQHFLDGYSKRVGCYEYADVPTWIENIPPFKIRTTKEQPNQYIFRRDFCDVKNIIHLTVFSVTSEILLDEVQIIHKGKKEITFNKPLINDGGYEYWVFDENDKLVHTEKCHWLLGISMDMRMIGRSVNIKYGKNEEKELNVSIENRPIKTEVKYPVKNPLNIINERQQLIYQLAKNKTNHTNKTMQKYFSKSKNTLQDIINYINERIVDDNSTIYFIDPFISKESLIPILGINKNDIKIEIISAWTSKDPDSEPDLSSSIMEIEKIKQKTIQTIKNIQGSGLPAARLIWHNLSKECFHDRYIYIKSLKNRYVFSLTNSLNNLLTRYDISIFEYDGENKILASKYLEELISKCCEDNRLFPEGE